jgi:hypothetical protein
MGEQDERERLRKLIPDRDPKTSEAAQRMVARAWPCDRCGYVTNNKKPIKIPAPCVQCGGIVFRVVNK